MEGTMNDPLAKTTVKEGLSRQMAKHYCNFDASGEEKCAVFVENIQYAWFEENIISIC
jgi:hypothetical protein